MKFNKLINLIKFNKFNKIKRLGDFYSFFNFGIQNSSGLKNLKIILETLMPKLYLLYIPTRSCKFPIFLI